MKNQNWIALTAVQVGGAICLPVLLIGFEISRQFGLRAAIISILIGNALLFALAMIGAKMSADSDRTTVEHAGMHLGQTAKKLFAVIITLSMCVWFAIQAQMMAQDVLHMLPVLPFVTESTVAFMITAIIIYCAMSGIKSIEKLATIAVPLLVATMIAAVYQGAGNVPAQVDTPSLLTSGGLSLVLATSIAAVIDLPTFFRHALNKKESYKAAAATFLIGIPLVEFMGALLSHTTQASSLIDALYCFEGSIWKIWILLFILLAGWTTNNANAYSASMSIKALFSRLSDRTAIGCIGIIAAVLSFCNIIGRLELFLASMGILIASMGGVMIVRSLIHIPTKKIYNQIAFVCGIVVGFSCLLLKGCITDIPIIDAFTVSAIGACAASFTQRISCKEAC